MDAITELVNHVIGERDQILHETDGREGPGWYRPDAAKFLEPMQEGVAFVPLFKAAVAVAGDCEKPLLHSLKVTRSNLINAALIYLRPYEDDLITRKISIQDAMVQLDAATMALSLAANRLADFAGGAGENPPARLGSYGETVSVDARACAILMENPTLSNKEIAKQVPCHPKYLSSSDVPKFKAAKLAMKSGGKSRPKGSKSSSGSIEAIGDEDLDFDEIDRRIGNR